MARSKNKKERKLRPGDNMEITNLYQGLKWAIGNNIRLTASFVTIEIDDDRQIACGLKNVRMIDDD